jgi:hypothetical protein
MDIRLPLAEVRMALKSGVSLFDGLSDEGFEQVVSLACDSKCAKNETLFRQGDAANAFYLVLSGRLKISQTTQDGQQISSDISAPRRSPAASRSAAASPIPRPRPPSRTPGR